MSIRSHILSMLIATVVAWVSWLLILNTIDPADAVWWGFALFYLCLFLSLFGSFTVLGFVMRTIMQYRRQTVQYRTAVSLRQALLWSSALIITLALQGQRLLTWWIFIIIIIVFALTEFTIVSMQQKPHS